MLMWDYLRLSSAILLFLELLTPVVVSAQTKSELFQALIRRGTVETIGVAAKTFADEAARPGLLPGVLVVTNSGCRFTMLDRHGDTKNANGWMFRGNAGDLVRALEVVAHPDSAPFLELQTAAGAADIRRAPWVVKDSVLTPSTFEPAEFARARFSATATKRDRDVVVRAAQQYIDACGYLW